MELKEMSTLKAVILSGVIGAIISFLPFFGIMISSIIAAYLTKKKSLLRCAGIGILAGLVSLIILMVIYIFTPFLVAFFAETIYGINASSCALGVTTGICATIISTSQTIGILFVQVAESFLFAGAIGGVIGSILANRKKQ